MKYVLFLFFSSLLTHVQASHPPYVTVEDLSTLSYFERKIGKIILRNDLHVYLISDPQVQQSAAAIAVEAGSWNDPKEYPGIAHFLEHLLFSGTKAYPNSSEYIQFIQDHGGGTNAVTCADKTVYAFSVHTDAYPQALDRFSHFFIDPLLSSDSVNQELYIIDQEYAKNVENDLWRLHMVLKETGNRFHPNHSFSIGNQDTLSKVPQSIVKDWYTKNYNANCMHLVMISSLPIDEMKNLAVQYFSAINNKEHLKASLKGPILSARQKGSMIFIKPIKDIKQLHLKWEIPAEFTSLEDPFAEFLSYILQKKVKGGLFAKLKDENLIEDLHVFKEFFSKENQVFSISVFLTEQGLLEKDSVISYVFSALERLKSELPEYLFEEFAAISTLSQKRESLDPVFAKAMEYASNMMYEDLSSYPDKTKIASRLDLQRFQRFLRILRPYNCAYFLIADPSKTGVKLTRKEKWTQAEYTIVPIDSKCLRIWEKTVVNPEIILPEANPYLRVSEDIPSLIYQDEGYQVYFQRTHSDSNGLIFRCKTPFLDGSPKARVLANLWFSLLKDLLIDEISLASDVGIYTNINLRGLDLCFKIHGINENVFLLTRKIFHTLKQADCSEKKFESYVDSLNIEYENESKNLPIYQAEEGMRNIVFGEPSLQEKQLALKNITREELCSFSTQIIQHLYIQAFLHVDLSQAQALELLQELQAILETKPYPINQHKSYSLAFPKLSSKLCLRTQQQGSAAVLLLQQGAFNFEAQATQEILIGALDNALFHTMRVQAPAYLVRTESINRGTQLLQFFSAQSSAITANDLLEHFESFIKNFDKNLETEIPLERFEQIRSTVITSLEKRAKSSSLEDSLEKNAFLAFNCQDFNWIKKFIGSLNALSYDKFCAIAHQMLSEKIPRVAVLVEGEIAKETNRSYQEFFSLEELVASYKEEEN